MTEMSLTIELDTEPIQRRDRSEPRYESYPTALQFRSGFDSAAYRRAALLSNAQLGPLSVYIRVPSRGGPCLREGNRAIRNDADQECRYVAALKREIDLQAPLFRTNRRVEQVRIGGDAPVFLGLSQLEALMRHLRGRFSLIDAQPHEYSIDIDPLTVPAGAIGELARLGFNCISLGMPDFQPAGETTDKLAQWITQTFQVVEAARRGGIGSIRFDIVCGTPRQTPDDFSQILATVLEARPGVVAVHDRAYAMALVRPQGQAGDAQLAADAQRLNLLQRSVATLIAAGYLRIGTDHFALPDDPLALACHRTFHGYCPLPAGDVIGLGVGAIAKVGAAYAQNLDRIHDYCAAVENHELAVERGLQMDSDDRIRHEVIQQLMCHGIVHSARIESHHCIDFSQYFALELARLQPMVAAGLLTQTDEGIALSDSGQLLAPGIAMTFDAYLRDPQASALSAAP